MITISKNCVELDEVENPHHRVKLSRKQEQIHEPREDRRSDRRDDRRKNDKRDHRTSLTSLTPLNASLSEVLVAIEKGPHQIPYPSVRPGQSFGPHKDLKCRYHRTNGHHTDDCRELAVEVEKLIQRGKLQQFKKETSPPQTNKRAKGIIMVIAGGPKFERQKRKRETNSNTDKGHKINIPFANTNKPEGPHADALVIEAVVEGYTMRRILIDTGSSANLITQSAFSKLKVNSQRVEPVHETIIGLSGNTVAVIGEVLIELEVGDEDHKWHSKERFLIIEAPLAYNMLLGRPFLSKSEAIISIRYLSLQIPITSGIAVAKGSQQIAQETYIASLLMNEPASQTDKSPRSEPTEELEAFIISSDAT